jgi:aminopeptidase N
MLTALLALAAAVAPLAAAPDPGKPPISEQTKRTGGPLTPEQAALDVEAVDLAIEVLPDRQALTGVATLTLTARAAVAVLPIDLDTNFVVRSIAVDGVALDRAAWRNPDGRLGITLPHPLAAGGRVTVTIAYAGTPHVAVKAPWDDGIVWSSAGGQPWIATTAQGYGCDLFWPCLDFPAAEIGRIDLHITVPKGLKAPANGALIGVDTLPDGRTTWHWRAKHINPYLVALQIGPYEELSGSYASRFGNQVPLYFWHLPGESGEARGLFAEFAPTLDFFESVIGPFPFADEKLGVVATPHLGMEHQTINAYGNHYAKAIEGFDWLFQHELAHEWFGNQMTAGNWDDFWLHEGFGNYLQPLYGQWREGDARYAVMMDAQRLRIRNKAPIVSGQVRTSEEVYEESKGGPGQDIYFKAAWMLHTLRYQIGDKAFFDATRRLVYGRPDPKPGNFTTRFGSTDEFIALVQQVTGRDYRWFFDVYLREAALPELIETRDGDRLTLTWRAPGGRPFPLPIDVRVGDRTERLAMTDGGGTLLIPPGAHVVIDPQAHVLRRSLAVEAAQAWAARAQGE